METKNSQLKVVLTYIAIFFLIVLIIMPPIFRVVFKEDNTKKEDTKDNTPITVLHCTKEETINTLTYNVQTYSTYKGNNIEKVIIRYKRIGQLDPTNQNNNYEQEMTNLKASNGITETEESTGSKFEIAKETLSNKNADAIINLYNKSIEEEQNFLISNNYTCQITKN